MLRAYKLIIILSTAAQDKQTRCAVLLARQQPTVAFQALAFETFKGKKGKKQNNEKKNWGLHSDSIALMKRLKGF